MVNRQSMEMPSIPKMSNITDLFANFQNNWYHLRLVFALLIGIIFAFFIVKKIIKHVKGG